MARVNSVQILGKVTNDKLEVKRIFQRDGTSLPVVNLTISYKKNGENRPYNIPVAVWGENVPICLEYVKKGDFIYVDGELRYNFIRKNGELEKIFTTIKAESIELVSKEIKTIHEEPYMNQVKLMGNVVEGDEEHFIMAVDRLIPRHLSDSFGEKRADFITVVNDSNKKIKGILKKGSFVIVEGMLKTLKANKEFKNLSYTSRIVVNAGKVLSY